MKISKNTKRWVVSHLVTLVSVMLVAGSAALMPHINDLSLSKLDLTLFAGALAVAYRAGVKYVAELIIERLGKK